MEPTTPDGRAERAVPHAPECGESRPGDTQIVRASFAALVEAARPRALRELAANPALRDARPQDWLRWFCVHAGAAFSALTSWCDDEWLSACIAEAAASWARDGLTPEQALSAHESALHPAVREVLTAEVFGLSAPSVSVPAGLPWEVAVRRAAFECLVRRTGSALESYLRLAWGLAPAPARALLDATLEAAWREFAGMPPFSDFTPWLARLVRATAERERRAATAKRRSGGHTASSSPNQAEGGNQHPSLADPSSLVSAANLTLRALGRLGPRERECLVLADVADFTDEQIAGILAIPVDRARACAQSARRRFTMAYARLLAGDADSDDR